MPATRAAPRPRRWPSGCSRCPGVAGVFFGYDFITVTKADGEWQHLKPAILGAIMEHFMAGQPILREPRRGRGARGGRGILRRGRRRHGRDDQGAARDPHPPGGRRRRRRHHLPRLQGRRRLSRHEGLLLRLPVLDRDPEARHPEPLCATSCRTCARCSRSEAIVLVQIAAIGRREIVAGPSLVKAVKS